MRQARAVAVGGLALSLVTATTAEAAGLIRDAETESLIRTYAQPILDAAGLSTQGVDIHLVNDRAFNAFVVDGHNMFIHAGALMDSRTPNQIIGVIAHETGHITGGHLARLRNQISRAKSAALMMQLIGLAAMAGAAGLVASSVVDRFPRRTAFLALYAGFLLGTLLCGLAPTYYTLVAARVATGACGGILGGMAMAMLIFSALEGTTIEGTGRRGKMPLVHLEPDPVPDDVVAGVVSRAVKLREWLTGHHRGVAIGEAVEDFRLACISRALDDREITLRQQSRVFFQISGAGHEALLLGLARLLRAGYDWFFPYYRDRALVLGLGVSPYEILLQAVGSADDPASGGRQMPGHYGSHEHNIVSVSSPT